MKNIAASPKKQIKVKHGPPPGILTQKNFGPQKSFGIQKPHTNQKVSQRSGHRGDR